HFTLFGMSRSNGFEVDSPTPPEADDGRPPRWWFGMLALCAATLAGYLFFPHVMHGQSKAVPPARAAASRTVSVVAAPARMGNIGVYLIGLGTATAINTVTVRSRVDGQLINVAFREGQLVHRGDLLEEIDPRPFQVQLTQAAGQAAKDEATFKNARIDLERYQDLFAKGLIPKQQLDTQAA